MLFFLVLIKYEAAVTKDFKRTITVSVRKYETQANLLHFLVVVGTDEYDVNAVLCNVV